MATGSARGRPRLTTMDPAVLADRRSPARGTRSVPHDAAAPDVERTFVDTPSPRPLTLGPLTQGLACEVCGDASRQVAV